MRPGRILLLIALICFCIPAIAQGPKTKHKLPPRNPKTGRFMKASKPAHKMPPRDPKTGRFMKKHKM
jgi:hypothetical protein